MSEKAPQTAAKSSRPSSRTPSHKKKSQVNQPGLFIRKSLEIDAKADARTRTGDPFITSEVLYQLSYVGG